MQTVKLDFSLVNLNETFRTAVPFKTSRVKFQMSSFPYKNKYIKEEQHFDEHFQRRDTVLRHVIFSSSSLTSTYETTKLI